MFVRKPRNERATKEELNYPKIVKVSHLKTVNMHVKHYYNAPWSSQKTIDQSYLILSEELIFVLSLSAIELLVLMVGCSTVHPVLR